MSGYHTSSPSNYVSVMCCHPTIKFILSPPPPPAAHPTLLLLLRIGLAVRGYQLLSEGISSCVPCGGVVNLQSYLPASHHIYTHSTTPPPHSHSPNICSHHGWVLQIKTMWNVIPAVPKRELSEKKVSDQLPALSWCPTYIQV